MGRGSHDFSQVSAAQRSIVIDMITTVRENVLDKMLHSPEDFDHDSDIEKVQKCDWFIRKFVIDKIEELANSPSYQSLDVNFLLDHSTEIITGATKMCETCLRWRKDNEVSDLSGSGIPKELFTKQIILIDERTKTLIIRMQVYKPVIEWIDVYERTARYMMELFDQTVKQGTLIIDLRNVTYKNIDHRIVLYLIDVYLNHYPQMFTHFVVYEIPWLIKPIAKVITMCLPERYRQKVMYCNHGSLLQLLDQRDCRDMPEFFGGDRAVPVVTPADSPSVYALGSRLKKSKTSTEAVAKILK